MQNRILHPAQPIRTTAQVDRRIATGITGLADLLDPLLACKGMFPSSYRAENSTIRCRIEFCTQHNQLERQHKSTGESRQVLQVWQTFWTPYWHVKVCFSPVIEQRIVPSDAESNSAPSTTN